MVPTDEVGRYRPEIETAIYYCCLEEMQRVMKHADSVKTISVSLAAENGDFRFEMRDDGAGFVVEDVTSGAGLTSMRDRLAAVGGQLRITTAPGAGTSVSGMVPLNGNGTQPLKLAAPLLIGGDK